jgi:dTDP-4-amino-4,6-dideoxygalactose transaminase
MEWLNIRYETMGIRMRELGFNYRITDFQCALGISQLKKLQIS